MTPARMEASLDIAAQRLPLRQWADALRKLDGEPLVWTHPEPRPQPVPTVRPRTEPKPRRGVMHGKREVEIRAECARTPEAVSARQFCAAVGKRMGLTGRAVRKALERYGMTAKVAKGAA